MIPSFKLLAAVVLGCTAISATALSFDEMTPAELQALPKWCAHTMTYPRERGSTDQYRSYVEGYGEGWTHVHHYCWALGSMVRHNQPLLPGQQKSGLVQRAIADIDYVLRNAPREFFLRREISSRKARLLQFSGSLQPALELAKEIEREWPGHADSHGLVAEILLSMNRRQEARKVLDDASKTVADVDRLKKIRAVLKI
jgi:hypothetical protein